MVKFKMTMSRVVKEVKQPEPSYKSRKKCKIAQPLQTTVKWQ